MQIELLDVIKIGGTYAVLVILIVRGRKDKRLWSAISYLRGTTHDNIEKKLFGFDKALQPKFFADEAGVITNANKAAEDFLGWKEVDMIGKNINIIFPKSEHTSWHNTFLKWKGEVMEQRSFLSVVTNKTGFEFPVEVTMRKEPYRDNSFYLLIIRDRSKEVQMIKKFEQLIEIYKMKLDILAKGEELGSTGSWIWDLEDNMLTMSDGYKKIIGRDARESNRIDASELRGRVCKGYETLVDGALRKAFAGHRYDITYEQRRPKDFKIVTVRSIVEPILNEDNVPVVFYGNTTQLNERDIV